MKKTFLTFFFAVLMGLCSLCAAAPLGTVLDAEAAAVDRFLTATKYKDVAPILHDELKEEFKEENFEKFRELVGTNLGALQSTTLRIIEKLDDADILQYQAHFEKDPTAGYVFYFRLVKNKPLLFRFDLLQTPKQAPAGQEQGK